jgi:hypothetical protein
VNDRYTKLYHGTLSLASLAQVPELLNDQSLDLGMWAARYAALGWPVFPCWPGEKAPLGRLAPHGYKDATTDPARIADWWKAWPEANIGCALAPAGLDITDLDGPQGIAELRARFGTDAFPPTPLVVRTGRPDSGWHLYYRHRVDELPVRATNCGAYEEYDLLSNGYIILPPSLHKSGNRYSWVTWDSFQQSVLEEEAA